MDDGCQQPPLQPLPGDKRPLDELGADCIRSGRSAPVYRQRDHDSGAAELGEQNTGDVSQRECCRYGVKEAEPLRQAADRSPDATRPTDAFLDNARPERGSAISSGDRAGCSSDADKEVGEAARPCNAVSNVREGRYECLPNDGLYPSELSSVSSEKDPLCRDANGERDGYLEMDDISCCGGHVWTPLSRVRFHLRGVNTSSSDRLRTSNSSSGDSTPRRPDLAHRAGGNRSPSCNRDVCTSGRGGIDSSPQGRQPEGSGHVDEDTDGTTAATVLRCFSDGGSRGLELQNAETKRVATTGGSRRLTMSNAGHKRVPLTMAAGPARLVRKRPRATQPASHSQSVLKNLLVAQKLRLGDGVQTRRTERLMYHGRSSLPSTGIKLEKLGDDYDPRNDTCLKAFVRLLSQRARAEAAVQ